MGINYPAKPDFIGTLCNFMKTFIIKLVILLPLVTTLAIVPFQGAFCDSDCSNQDEPCKRDDDTEHAATLKCCPIDRTTSVSLKCDAQEAGEIGTCIPKE